MNATIQTTADVLTRVGYTTAEALSFATRVVEIMNTPAEQRTHNQNKIMMQFCQAAACAKPAKPRVTEVTIYDYDDDVEVGTFEWPAHVDIMPGLRYENMEVVEAEFVDDHQYRVWVVYTQD